MIQYFSREDFSNIGLPEVGAVILFTAINGREMPRIVYEVMAESITVDFNHPLAGHSVNFDIEVLKIDPQDGKKMKILLANPRGFCAGVYRAISIVESALKIYGPPIYVRHEVVHNRYVVEDLRKRGAIFIEHISQVPDGSVLIFSAHGVSQAVKAQAKARQLKILFDATCPLVTKVHMEVLRASRKGQEAILIGHAGHPEVEGTMGQYDNASAGVYLVESVEDVNQLKVKDENNLCFMTQTTLSVDDTLEITSALQKRFPKIIGPRKDDICYATTNRQQAVRELSEKSDMVLVVGSKNSSNSNRLAELAKRMGKPAYLIDSDADIHADWLKNIKYIGVTAGASAPDVLVQKVIITLQSLGADESIEMMGQEENIVFEIPKQLRIHATEISCS